MAERGQELLEHGLRDMYDAEHRFADALGTMIEQVQDASLRDGFRRHLRVTREQARRLEDAFDELGLQPSREKCAGARGLIEEYETFVSKQRPDAAVLNAYASEAGLKVEHYEIAGYRSLLNLAQFLGLQQCARVFRQNLAEEEQAAAELQSAGTRLTADLTGATGPGVVKRAAGTLFDQVREGAFMAAGTARSVGEQAAGRTGKAIQRAERRGRKAVRTARARGQAARTKSTRKSTGTRRSGSTARRTSGRATSKTTARRRTTSRPAARKTSASRSTTRRTTRAPSRTGARRTTRRTTGRASTRRS